MLSKPPSTHLAIPTTRRGLSLALLTRTRNPSKFARALYLSPDLAPHAFLSGEYTESDLNGRLKDRGMELALVDPTYFWTEGRWREHRRGLGLPEEDIDSSTGPALLAAPSHHERSINLDVLPQGTVGAVALDIGGCIATVTSTGGKTNKLIGRIGDTPSMGSGFWAEEWTVPRKGFKATVRRFFKMSHRVQHRAVGVSGTGDGDVRVPTR
jgi:isoaspartyl peptidase/L-asparaginase-like protein (Ntn-hydrolase superfamily)